MKTRYDDRMLYWTNAFLLSFSYATVYIAMSIRNLGKSYTFMKLVRKALRKGYSCVCSRWDAGELGVMVSEFFRDVALQADFEKVAIKNTSGEYWEHRKTHARVYFLPVKEAHKFKGLDIPNLRWWFYDEFIPEFYPVKTRKTEEFRKWASMYTTLRRNNKNMKCILCANCISWFNGYFDAWGIRPFPSGSVRTFPQIMKIDDETVRMDVVMENVKPTKAQIKRVVADEVLKGKTKAEIDDYLNNNTYDNTTFIRKCPDPTVPLSTSQWKFGGRWYSYREYRGIMYWSEQKARRNDIAALAMSVNDIEENTRLPKDLVPWLESNYMAGNFRFDNGFIESAIVSGIYSMRTRL